MLRILEADVLPGFSAVGGFVNSITPRHAVARVGFSCAHPDCVGIRRVRGHGSDSADGLMFEDRLPGGAFAGAFPHTATAGREINVFRRIARDGNIDHAPARPGRAHRSPGEMFEKTFVELLAPQGDGQDRKGEKPG